MAHCGVVAIRNRLYPAADQEFGCLRHCAHARFVWNLAVEQQSWWWPGRGSAPGSAERQRQLAEARGAEPWLQEGSSSVQQQALRDFDRAMAAFFDPANPTGKPRFRTKRGAQGFVIRDTRVRRLSRSWGQVFVPKDWAEKLSTRFVQEHDIIALEKLNIKGMTHKPAPKPDPDRAGSFLPNKAQAKAGLSRGILASCWGTLGQRIEQKAQAAGAAAVFTDARFTSQQCCVCGYTSPGNRNNQAAFMCEECGHQDHADVNAAKNILARGLALIADEIVPAHAPGHGVDRPRKSLARAGAAGTTRTAA